MTRISIIIVNYNAAAFLEGCLNAVRAATREIKAEIIVVDNASSDESCELIRSKYPEVKRICNTVNSGFSKANNQAVKQARGKYLLFLNPDTLIGEGSLKKVLGFAEKQESFGALGVRMIDGGGRYLPESKRKIPTLRPAFLKMIGKDRSYYDNDLDEFENGATSILAGAFLLIQKTVFEQAGGFDEAYFMYGEDVDLCYSLLQKGFMNYYYGSETILHFKGESGRKDRRYAENFYGAMQIFYNKYFAKSIVDHSLLKLAVKGLIFLSPFKNSKPEDTQPAGSYLFYPGTEAKEELKISLKKALDVQFSDHLENIDDNFTHVILDQAALSNQAIISLLQDKRLSGFKKRIRPAGSFLIVGSDFSDKQGEVIRF